LQLFSVAAPKLCQVFLLGRAGSTGRNNHQITNLRSSLHHRQLRLPSDTAASRRYQGYIFQPHGTWTLHTAQLGPLQHELRFLVRNAQQGKSSPVDHFAILPGSSGWPLLLSHTVKVPRNAPTSILPLPSPSPRALCVARFNTRSFPIIKPAQP
jgi:hypothetical protein